MAKSDQNKALYKDIEIDESLRAHTNTSFLMNLIVGLVGTALTMAIFYPMKYVSQLN